MNVKDKTFIFGSIIVIIVLALAAIFVDTPLQKVAKEYNYQELYVSE